MSERINISESRNGNIFPCVATRDIVVFPNMSLHFDVARERSVAALKAAFPDGEKIFLTAQIDVEVAEPGFEDVYHIGVVAKINQIVKAPDGVLRVHVEGLYRAKLVRLVVGEQGYLEAEVRRLPNYSKEQFSDVEVEALSREVKLKFEEYASLMPRMPRELFSAVMGSKSHKQLFETIAFNIAMSTEDRQDLLERNTVSEKLANLLSILAREIQIIEIEQDIQSKVSEQIDKGQRDFYLREQMRVISRELGEDEDTQSDSENYIEKINSLQLSKEVEDKLTNEAKRLAKMPAASQEAVVIRT